MRNLQTKMSNSNNSESIFNKKRSKVMVNTGNTKRSLQVPLKNYKVSVPGAVGPQTKKLLSSLCTIPETRVSHIQVYTEAPLTLPRTHYPGFKQLSFGVRLSKTEMLSGQKALIFRKDNSAPSFPAFDVPHSVGCSFQTRTCILYLWIMSQATVIIAGFWSEHNMVLPFPFNLWKDSSLCAFA